VSVSADGKRLFVVNAKNMPGPNPAGRRRSGSDPTFRYFGSFGSNVGGLQTPELEIADDDIALGKLVSAVSHSLYCKDTAIFRVEDDAQDGTDHLDAHRSPGYVISAYTKRHTVVHTFYNTISMLRSIEDFLGLQHLGMNDANAKPMADVFNTQPDLTPYD